jgi:hypothetical protein
LADAPADDNAPPTLQHGLAEASGEQRAAIVEPIAAI